MSKQTKRKTQNVKNTLKSKNEISGINKTEFRNLCIQCQIPKEKVNFLWSSFITIGRTMVPHQKNYINLLKNNLKTNKCCYKNKTFNPEDLKYYPGISEKEFCNASQNCGNTKIRSEKLWESFVIIGKYLNPHKNNYIKKIKKLQSKY